MYRISAGADARSEAAGYGFENCSYNTFGVDNVQAYLAQGQVVTTIGEGAFIGALGSKSFPAQVIVQALKLGIELSVPMLRQNAGSILGNEARQNSKLREGLNLNFFNGES